MFGCWMFVSSLAKYCLDLCSASQRRRFGFANAGWSTSLFPSLARVSSFSGFGSSLAPSVAACEQRPWISQLHNALSSRALLFPSGESRAGRTRILFGSLSWTVLEGARANEEFLEMLGYACQGEEKRISIIHAGVAAGDDYKGTELSSSAVSPAVQDTGFSTGTRTICITVCGVIHDNDLRRLKSQVEYIDGVGQAWFGPSKEGGVRGGSVSVQIEVEKRVPFPALIQSIQSLDETLLILPFKSNSWLWRGYKINYSVSGCGKPLILIHGFGGNVGHFARLTPFLSETHRVYAIDLLGFGASDKPSDIEYGPELWAELVCDFANEFAGEGSVLFGNSIGSLTVLAAAKTDTNLFKGVVLLNCAGAMNRKGLAQDGLVLRLITPIFIAVEYLLQSPKVAKFLFNKFRSKDNVKQILQQQAYRDKGAVTDQLVDILHHPSTDEGALDVFVKVFTGDPGPRPEVMVPKISVPMFILWGEEDAWTPANGPVANYFKRVAAQRDNVFVKILPDVGHCPHDDRPEIAAREILPFLGNYNL